METGVDEKIYDAVQWRHIGPFRGGRSAAVCGVPNKPNLFYMGATGGGVWKTEDGGRSWKNISDGYFGGSIGAITVSEYDPNVIYVGGGEVTVRGNVSSGSGVWKSEDAGKTWKSMGLKNSRHIPRIRVHPRNPDLVYVAVMGNLYKDTDERGVYRSKDGGKTWTALRKGLPQGSCFDIVFRHCLGYHENKLVFGTTSGSIYFSENNGKDWICLTSSLARVESVVFV